MRLPLRPPSSPRPFTRRAAATLVAALALLGGALAGTASSAGSGQLQQKLSSGHARVNSLAGAVQSATQRVNRLGAGIAALERRIAGLQSDLNAQRGQLLALRSQLHTAQVKLGRLESTQARDEQVLARQLVGSYEVGQPDLITVVLESHGFSDLLESLDFAQRIGHHDAQITAAVRSSRRAVAAQATRLGTLSARQQRLTEQVLAERNRVASARLSLVTQQIAVARARATTAGQLASARSEVASLQQQLLALQARQRAAAAAAARRLAAAAAARRLAPASAPAGSAAGSPGASSSPPASAPPGSGGFTFPLPKSAASPPSTWSPDDGVDISAPGGTPEYAVCSGTVVLHGIGGFGPSAPVLHCDGQLAGYDYVYYGHAGPGNWVPIGTHVSQGQVISEVGSGIVGISTGPHLEIGFADSSGGPVGPGSAGAMLSLLQSSY